MRIFFPTDPAGTTVDAGDSAGQELLPTSGGAAAANATAAPSYTVTPCKVLKVHEDTADHWPDARAVDAIEVVPYNLNDSEFKVGTRMFYDVMPDCIPVDQKQYLAAVDDVVWVYDGPKPLYRTRFEPFYGQVTDVATTYVTVRMMELTGDPDDEAYEGVEAASPVKASLSGADVMPPRPGLTIAENTYFDFEYVKPLRCLRDEPHALKEDDVVMVFQRGRYLVCVDDKQALLRYAKDVSVPTIAPGWNTLSMTSCLADGSTDELDEALEVEVYQAAGTRIDPASPLIVELQMDTEGKWRGHPLEYLPTTFPAKITGAAAYSGEYYRWKYAWTEMVDSGDSVASATNGRSGTTSTDYALNDFERFHTSTIAGGVALNGDDYPAGFAPMPIGGAGPLSSGDGIWRYPVVVQMHERWDATNSKWVYRFSAPISHDGTCEAAT